MDTAMSVERPAKQTIRMLWVEQARSYRDRYPADDVPLYLTLSGSEGRDIRLLIDHNLVKQTEVGGIAAESLDTVIAVERSPQAVLQLQKQFPGLKILQLNFRELVAGDSPIRFPVGEHERLCRARIVNLDLQEPLSTTPLAGEVAFPVLTWIKKLCQIHATPAPREWCLCLTLNGSLVWAEDVCQGVQHFFAENFERAPGFSTACQTLLGGALHASLARRDHVDFAILEQEAHQKILMVFVPKKIAQLVHDEGWKVSTSWNLRYGGDSSAPMVTWVLMFKWDARASMTPEAVYRESLGEILMSAGVVADDGRISVQGTNGGALREQ